MYTKIEYIVNIDTTICMLFARWIAAFKSCVFLEADIHVCLLSHRLFLYPSTLSGS